ncbi:MAG: hypothetical protein AB8G23_21750 [Myxococcota bacterium]
MTETIPDELQVWVDAALESFNAEQSTPFDVTGILDSETSLGMGSTRDLRLVLCGGDACEQHSFRVTQTSSGFEVASLSERDAGTAGPDGVEVLAELDPPPGARRNWLSQAQARHKFIVLVFYRGFW